MRSAGANVILDVCSVDRDHVGVLFIDGKYIRTLSPGPYAFWRGRSDARLVELDMREQMLEIAGQEIMTRDKVSLRLNAQATYRIRDARLSVERSSDVHQSLYREIQLALRAVTGARLLDEFLIDKESVASEMKLAVASVAEALGVEVLSIGIRDVILPGDMKTLLNRVTEAQKAAEANLISRREETAAIRSQANTAKLLADNPTLMRLRELEVLEKIAATNKLNIVLGEKGLADRVINLL
jgi:regulator of protease activity HflC (stomatin/prohibitin superfamily)